jgi:predicted TIM-barrel fold metal-dependent hydrolase
LVEFAQAGRPVDFPVFDMHGHIGEWSLFDNWPLTEHLAEMERVGVRRTAISSLAAIAGDIAAGNDQVAAVARAHPDRFIGYAHVNANYPELIAPELERAAANPAFRGIKVYQQGVAYDDPRFEPVWEFAAARGWPVLAHTWAGQLTGFDRVAQRHPQTVFFAAHAGSDFVWQPYVDAARRARNFYLDLTYSRDHANLLEHLVREVGADQIVWGSDQPLFSLAQQLSKVLFARIADRDKEKILYRNAARAFRLPPP